MNIIEKKIHHIFGPAPSRKLNAPKSPVGVVASALNSLSARLPELQSEFDRTGHIRHLTAGVNPLFRMPVTSDARIISDAFLQSTEVHNGLELGNVELNNPVVEETAYGHRVDYRQQITLKDGSVLPVRGAFVNVHVNKKGEVFNLTSTLKVFPRRKVLGTLISKDAAIAAAKKHMEGLIAKLGEEEKQYQRDLNGALATCSARAELVLSEDKGKFDPVYEVNLSICEPRQLMHMLVMARTGEVVYHESKLHFSVATNRQKAGLTRIPARAILRILDPNTPVAKQIVDHYIDELPDPSVLKNHRFEMLIKKGGKWVNVKAKADGSYNFDEKKEKDEFAAVMTFILLNTQLVWMEQLGMKTKYPTVKVYINDPSVRDNAYFDPENWEIHIGIGSGIGVGLVKDIFLDIGVTNHEEGHEIVTIQTPGNDLPGPEGGAAHEASGDVIGQIWMSYMFRVVFGSKMGFPITVADIQADARIIGAYALPPDGIRKQRNTKTVKDKTGEVHDDGEIVGAALADLLEAFCVAGGDSKLKDSLENYARLYLMGLSLVPAARVTFRDIRRALITADQQLFTGSHKTDIEGNFDKRGITGGNSAGGTTTRPRRRRKMD